MMRYDKKTRCWTLSTGTLVRANGGILGLAERQNVGDDRCVDRLTEGYDGSVWLDTEVDDLDDGDGTIRLTTPERQEIADAMIARWRAWGLRDAAPTVYACGFAFDLIGQVALIQKNRPAWQAGLLNGIGGHVEAGETPLQAMEREFKEETGVTVTGWELFAVCQTGTEAVCYMYRVTLDHPLEVTTTTDEQVGVWPIDAAKWTRKLYKSVYWQIELALAEPPGSVVHFYRPHR